MEATPLILDDIERAGATRYGRGVMRVTIEYDDGRKAILDLPRPFNAPQSEEQLREHKITVFMAKFGDGEGVKGQTIAAEIDEEYDTIRKTLSGLVKREVLYSKQGVSGYYKGSKFAVL
jgi:hypothetical protein